MLYGRSRRCIFIFLSALILGASTASLAFCAPSSLYSQTNVEYNQIISSINFSAVEDHLKYFTSLGSRVTGYPGCEAAAKHIQNYFDLYLHNVTYQKYNITIPYDYGATLHLTDLNQDIEICPLEPNLISPVVCNTSGPLFYVADGRMEDFNGIAVDGSIVLMNFNTGQNWINAAKMGAKAVIFIEPEETTPEECSEKSVNIPFKYPRLYMCASDATNLLSILHSTNKTISVQVNSRMSWRELEAKNIIAFMEGETHKDEVIMLSAHYDSYSVVPSQAPGANDAVGAATLLEIARLFTIYKPKYTIMLVAYSGHHQILEGSKKFLEEYFFGKQGNVGKKIILQLNLQLSTMTNNLALNDVGKYQRSPWQRAGWYPFKDFSEFATKNLINTINNELKTNYKLINVAVRDGGTYDLNINFPTADYSIDDCEPLSVSLGPGYSIVTIDHGNYLQSPLDTYDKLNLGNLRSNIEETICIIWGLISTENLKNNYLSMLQSPRQDLPSWKVQVAVYNETTGWYDGIQALVVFGFDDYWPRPIVTKTTENGTFTVNFIPATGTLPLTAAGANVWPYMRAFVLNDTTGDILFAPTQGVHRWAAERNYPAPTDMATGAGKVSNPRKLGFLVVSKCSTAVLFDTFFPSSLRRDIPIGIRVLRWEIETEPDSHAVYFMQDMATVFVPPSLPLVLIIDSPFETMPLAVLTNASKDQPNGMGYVFEMGEQYIFDNTMLQYATNMHLVSKYYFETLNTHGVTTDKIIQARNLTSIFISKADEALQNQQYSELYECSLKAWSQARAAYGFARADTADIVYTVPFVSLLLVPFTFFFERLVFHSDGRRRIAFLLITFLVFDITFGLVHAGFSLASNPAILIISYLIVIMLLPATYMMFSYAAQALKELRLKIKGYHLVEVSRGSAAVLAFQTGIENLRKRKHIALLTFLTVILVTIGIVMFTSLSTLESLRPLTRQKTPIYKGIYIRDPEWGSIGSNILDFLEAAYSGQAEILPRAWLYTSFAGSLDYSFKISHENRTYALYAITGLTSNRAPEWLPGVTGRWFIPEDMDVCILPNAVAKALNVTYADTVVLMDRELTVVGIVNDDFLDYVKELDEEAITPWDQTISYQSTMHVPGGLTMIVPFEFLMQYNPAIVSVSVIPKDPTLIPSISEEIFRFFNKLHIQSGYENEMTYYSLESSYMVLGWQLQVVPVVLSALIMLNLMIASVKAREREIFIYSSVGLSPFHISFMFLAESLIYAIVGGTIGYMTAMSLYASLRTANLITMTVNLSSSFVSLSLGAILLVMMLSSLYPAFKASRAVTPSLERAWKTPTKPVGATWEIPLPVLFTDDAEALGAIKYLKEYIEGQVGEVGKFSAENITLHDEKDFKSLTMDTHLAPYSQNVRQRVEVHLEKGTREEKWTVNLILVRTSGRNELWIRLVRDFADEIRKQFLLWRTLRPSERSKYIGS